MGVAFQRGRKETHVAGRPITDDLELMLEVLPPPLREALEGQAGKNP